MAQPSARPAGAPAGLAPTRARPVSAAPTDKKDPKKGRRTAVVILAVVVVITVLAAFWGNIFGGASAAQTIEPTGKSWTIPANSYLAIGFSLSTSASVGTSFTSSGPVMIYAMSDTAYKQFSQSSETGNASWSSGVISGGGTFSVNLGSGSWHLVVESAPVYNPVSVVLTAPLVATPS